MRSAARVVGAGRRALDHGGVWTTIGDGWLTLAVSRPPVTLEQRIPIEGTGSGSLVLPLEPLRRVILSRRSGDAEFEGDDESIEFRSRAFRAEILAFPARYVLVPDGPVDAQHVATIGGAAFRAGLDHTVLSMSHRYGWRPDLAGLEITARADTLRFAATDLETLAIAEFRDPSAEDSLDAPLIVTCYHGNSSQSAAAYLVGQGFSDVYSLDGGFELWRATYPDETAHTPEE